MKSKKSVGVGRIEFTPVEIDASDIEPSVGSRKPLNLHSTVNDGFGHSPVQR